MINPNDPVKPVIDNSNLPHILVILNKGAMGLRSIRCIYCGMIVWQENQSVKLVYIGKVLEEKLGHEVRCERCKTVYVFL